MMPLAKVPQLAEGQRNWDVEPGIPHSGLCPLSLITFAVSSQLIAGPMNKHIWWPWICCRESQIKHPMWSAGWQNRAAHLRKECTPLTLLFCRWELVLEVQAKACWVSKMFTVMLYSKMILPSFLLFFPFFFLSPSFFPSLPPFFLSFSFLCSLLSSIYRIGDLSHGLPLATELCLQPLKGITSEVTSMAQIQKFYGWTIMQPI